MKRRGIVRVLSSVASLAAVSALVSLSGCTPVRAWERGLLAHPTMKPGSPAGLAETHRHEVQEGASGGVDSEGGGCGCN
jgi:hypothetical protein